MDYMEQAVALARQALGRASPNPAVGAVLVRDGRVVGEGFTGPPGGHHAEVTALEQAGPRARGATLYVTLEPCVQYGRTPPCTDALLRAGVRDVHLATLDPNPMVNGNGRRQLEITGIHTTLGEHEEEACRVNEAYMKHITTGVPFVVAKFASSLDGKIATISGDSRWISGKEARQQAHQIRDTVDAIMVGIGTVLADNPMLTTRHNDSQREHTPLRVIVDSEGRTPTAARMFLNPGHVLIATAGVADTRRRELEKTGAEVVLLPSEDNRVDLAALLRHLGQCGITSVLVEGGGTLLGSFFDQRLVDKVIAFISPIILGGAGATTAVAGHGYAKLKEAPRLHKLSMEQVGKDIMVVGYPVC